MTLYHQNDFGAVQDYFGWIRIRIRISFVWQTEKFLLGKSSLDKSHNLMLFQCLLKINMSKSWIQAKTGNKTLLSSAQFELLRFPVFNFVHPVLVSNQDSIVNFQTFTFYVYVGWGVQWPWQVLSGDSQEPKILYLLHLRFLVNNNMSFCLHFSAP